MTFDLRLPIGLMFTFFGLILTLLGFASDPSLYVRSLNININLIWGAVMLVFGVAMLWLALRKSRNERRSNPGSGRGAA